MVLNNWKSANAARIERYMFTYTLSTLDGIKSKPINARIHTYATSIYKQYIIIPENWCGIE